MMKEENERRQKKRNNQVKVKKDEKKMKEVWSVMVQIQEQSTKATWKEEKQNEHWRRQSFSAKRTKAKGTRVNVK